MKYKLTQLFKEYNITGINFNSKKIKKGEAFFAIKGSVFDGNDYIQEAIDAGAKLVFSDVKLNDYEKLPLVYVENVKDALAIASEILYPEMPRNLIAVTGTNGKTSVVSYCQQLLELLGESSASMGTVGIECSKKQLLNQFQAEEYKSLTTADTLTFRQVLNELAKNDINHVAFEASSHGIEQQRMGNLKVQAAAFTSFSQDHLDYHKTMKKYLDAKLKLFSHHLQPYGLAVISSEISELDYIKDFFSRENIRFQTVGKNGDVKILATKQSISGQDIILNFEGKDYDFQTEIIGSFQAGNIMIAALLIREFGFSIEQIIDKIVAVKAVKGRLERVTDLSDPYHIFVDYSHTPASLENALHELNKIKPTSGRLIVVFGCGGNRDASKRPIMGKIADMYADIAIITDDNPRFEAAAEIRRQIIENMSDAIEIGGRKTAINYAIDILNKDDILLIAGKGHEDYQIIKDSKISFDDVKVARDALGSKK